MSKFTQGTWKPCIDGSVDIEDDRGHLIGTICDIVRLYEDEAEAMANSRLIASAPEMYRLLNKAHSILYRFTIEGAIDVVDLKTLVKESAELLNRIDGEEEQS